MGQVKQKTEISRRKRIIAAICAAVVMAGGSTGIYAFSANDDKKPGDDESKVEEAKKADDGIISAGGTIESSQLSDELGLKDTAVKLTVEEVLVSEGDSVEEGTQLYKLTADSVTKAKKTLESEKQSTNEALIKQKATYESDKIKAETLYKSELLQGGSSAQDYANSLSELDSALQKASDSYQEALSTISSVPSQISTKQSELDSKQATADSLQTQKDSEDKQLTQAGKDYSSAAQSYNSVVTQYNSAASVVIYLGNALGKDTSGIKLAQSVSVDVQGSGQGGSTPSQPSGEKPSGEKPGGDLPSFSSGKDSAESSTSGTDDAPSEMPGGTQPSEKSTDPQPTDPVTPSQSSDVQTLYEKAYKEYTTQQKALSQANGKLSTAKTKYETLNKTVSQTASKLTEAQSSVSTLKKEISELESTLSKAKSNLNKLRSEYTKLSNSYESDKLELKNKMDTDNAASENAKFNYDITLSTIESELEEKQTAYDTAAENLSIFEKSLSGGYICAKQAGTVYSLSYSQGKNADVSKAFVTYVDKSEMKTTVELDQYEVTEISIGDTVVIYSSETGVSNGKITAIAAGESTSLVDVKFNVTVTADENANVYSGQSVNVYFNYSAIGGMTDFSGGDDSQKGGRSQSGERPDFSGQMPEGFDPSNMSSFDMRKGDE